LVEVKNDPSAAKKLYKRRNFDLPYYPRVLVGAVSTHCRNCGAVGHVIMTFTQFLATKLLWQAMTFLFRMHPKIEKK
jgi:hypothetical protein